MHRALVIYNAAVAAAAQASGNPNPILRVGGQQLAPFVHSPQRRAVLALPGQDVEIVRGNVRPDQIASHRPSYINAILIQSRGQAVADGCGCLSSIRPAFPECRRIARHFDGACANCKWKDHAARCSVRGDGGGHDGGPRRLAPQPNGGDGTRQRPLLIEEDNDDEPGARPHNAIVLA